MFMKKNYKHTCRYDEATNDHRLAFISDINRKLKCKATDSAVTRALYIVLAKSPRMRDALIKALIKHFK
jgi:hypothetical protein